MKKNKVFLKIIYAFLLISLIFSNSIGTAQALFGGGPSVPSTGEVLEEVERRYGFDNNILRRAKQKADYPQAEIFFSNNEPKIGEEVIATALPKYFKNTNENLYYTWFLFRDGEDDLEKAKQLAMGLVARGEFDPYLFGTDYSGGDIDSDKDGYEASYGGDDGRGGKKGTDSFLRGLDYSDFESKHYIKPVSKQTVDTTAITRCYRHNFGVSEPDVYTINNAGGDLIVPCEHKFPKASKGKTFSDPLNPGNTLTCYDDYEVGDGEFEIKEELCWQLDPKNPDTDGDGFVDEADLAGLGQQQLSWTFREGDRVGVVIEGMSMIAINESTGITQIVLNPKIIHSCGRVDNNVDYCVDSDGDVGRCVNEACYINTCTDRTTDIDEPCVTSGGGVGTCSFMGVIGTCDAVNDCSDPDSSKGDLCEKDNIAGICLNSYCVLSRCGDMGDPCQTDLGTLGSCNEIGFCEEDRIGEDDLSMNPYYKIMWAGLDFCDPEKIENKNKEDLIDNDECEGDRDYGFNYLATKRVAKEGEDLLKTNLNFTPSEPQANKAIHDYSDYITVTANFIRDEVKDDFVYYEWDIYYCNENQIVNGSCTEDSTRLLTSGCGEDTVLGSCGDHLDSEKYAKGMGLKQIRFRGDEEFYSNEIFSTDEKMYFKVFLKTKENKNTNKMSISSVDIPLDKNEIAISLFNVDSNETTFSSAFSEICDDPSSEYYQICPVYTGQILGAAYDGPTDITSAFWEIDGERVYLPGSNPWSLPEGYQNFIFLPVRDSGMELKKITFKALTNDGEEVVSERIISTAKTMVKKISSDNLSSAWPWQVASGGFMEESENVLVALIGEDISLKADIVPSYLESSLISSGISFKWYLNNEEITSAFKTAHPDYNISTSGSNINFNLEGEEGDSFNLKVEIFKDFSSEEETFLEDHWGISNLKELKADKSITIKQTEKDNTGIVKGNSVKMFFASTFQNSSSYLIFIIKTAIVTILFWSLIYGLNYKMGRETKIVE